MKMQPPQQLTLFDMVVRPDMLEVFPLLRELIQYTEPALLDGSTESGECIAQIITYVYSRPGLRDKKLKSSISNELYQALYGLKKYGNGTANRRTERVITAHKQRYLYWLKTETEEE